MSQFIQRIAATAAVMLMLLSPLQAASNTSFLTGPQDGDPYQIALAYIQGHLADLGLSAEDLAELEVQDQYRSKHNSVTHIYLQQRLGGIDVFNAVMNVNVAADGSIVNLNSSFIGKLADKINSSSPRISDIVAIGRAAEPYGASISPGSLVQLSASGNPDRAKRYSSAGISRDEIPVNLVYVPADNAKVRLAWSIVINLIDSPDWWNVRVDALSGEIISQNNWTSYDSYLAIPYPPFSDPEDSSGQSVIADPANATASPFGWHDTNGVSGAESTLTRGNNVNAQDDIDANNAGGSSPDGGATLDFAFAFDPLLQPDGGTNLEAGIVNLFYANNVMHDLSYQYGFDETSGNFQVNNYGNGGAGSDAVEADAQDGSGTDNANFSTPPDGFRPRMQMFRWLVIPNAKLAINSPGSIAGDYDAQHAGWGGSLPTTADIEVVNDNGGTPTEGCNPLVGFTAGNIALIDRGSCEFGSKALNAENAGAAGVIVVNNQQLPNGLFSMGAGVDGNSVTIPAVMIGNADGATVRNEIPTVNGSLETIGGINRDSDLDNGIIAHEYGHGISNRLTGGPGNTSCLFGTEQGGEGWSDFWALVTTAKVGDTAVDPQVISNYLTFFPGPGQGPGIRNFPYSTDLKVNPQTYKDIFLTNVPHGVGEIWMSMVWEVYWELVAKHGFDPDIYAGTGGNNLTIQLVVDGMKMQPCGPSFVTARDAILAADQVNNGGANQCEIWRGFAKRGLGTLAIPGSVNVGDETEDFSVPIQCTPGYIFSEGFE